MFSRCILIASVMAAPHVAEAASTETILNNFLGGTHQGDPECTLIRDTAGNLFGTTSAGGPSHAGTVFMLSPPTGQMSEWTMSTLYSFTDDADGATPSAGLLSDGKGDFFGTTTYGGFGYDGTVFEISPPLQGQTAWTKTTIYAFGGGKDGAEPLAALVADAAGNLYGTTQGGKGGYGTVFELTPPAGGSTAWTETVLHVFKSRNDGAYPASGLVIDSQGNLYGTTPAGGGARGAGIVFELAPPAAGSHKWNEVILHRFGASADGAHPSGQLIGDPVHGFFGEAFEGGTAGYGTVFKVSPRQGRGIGWKEHTLYSFTGGNDGGLPSGGLIVDHEGNLYGTTGYDTQTGYPMNGNVFELVRPASGKKAWMQTVLYAFMNNGDGSDPQAGIMLAPDGNFYGTTTEGGTDGDGTVFKISP